MVYLREFLRGFFPLWMIGRSPLFRHTAPQIMQSR